MSIWKINKGQAIKLANKGKKPTKANNKLKIKTKGKKGNIKKLAKGAIKDKEILRQVDGVIREHFGL